MSLLFAATLFVSAALLFWVQPLIAKMLLPLLGGTPAVWNTCMLFFQGMLLAGYAYALALTRWLRSVHQGVLHVALLLLAGLVSLPLGLSEALARSVPAEGEPVWWLLGVLLATLGLPFFALAASAPLLQKWFSETRHPSARDPYFLYAASNAGSLAALVSFPLLLEPSLRLTEQGKLWAVVYTALVALIVVCALTLRRAKATDGAARADVLDEGEDARRDERAGEVTIARRLGWAFLAFVPSSLVLGVTTYITTDVAAVPLLWVIPLALYLLTYVLAFARRAPLPRRWTDRLLAGAAIVLTLVYLSGATEPVWFLIPVHLIFFFIAAYVCHRRLADERPSTEHLAEFYLWIAVGGVAGGLFNAIIAPLVFRAVIEYPLAIVLACLARASVGTARKDSEKAAEADDVQTDERELTKAAKRARVLDFALPAATGVVVAVLSAVVMRLDMTSVERLAVALGVPLMLVNHLFTKRPLRFALALGAVMLASALSGEGDERVLHAERNFYGTLRVIEDPSNSTRRLHHGSTIHGRQFVDEMRACEPLSYYHRQGPLGSMFKAFDASAARSPHVAAVGLGAGTIVSYSRPEQTWTFYEINPAVVRIASGGRHFTYLRDCARAPVEVVLGDARLKLRDAPDGHYGLIIFDAFSSDAVPPHLLTREALDLYLSKLAPRGWLAFHVSNRSLDLHSVVAGITHDAGVAALFFDDLSFDTETGREPSQWIMVARSREDLAELRDARWLPLAGHTRRLELWRDDFSNIVTVFKWGG